MNKAFTILEIILIAGVIVSGTVLAKSLNVESGNKSEPEITEQEDTASAIPETEVNSAALPRTEPHFNVSPKNLASIFYYEYSNIEPAEEIIVETPEITLPTIQYAGKIQMEGNVTTYLFTNKSTGHTLRLKEGENKGDLVLIQIEATTSGTQFTLSYQGEKITVLDR